VDGVKLDVNLEIDPIPLPTSPLKGEEQRMQEANWTKLGDTSSIRTLNINQNCIDDSSFRVILSSYKRRE